MNKSKPSWPMANYKAAWKTFRRVGNEPATTADYVFNQPHWPKKKNLRIIDIGCGDGRMLEAFLLKSRQQIAKAILLDPDKELLNEAASEIGQLSLKTEIATVLGEAEISGAKLARAADVGLAIHLAYLMPEANFRSFIERWPRKIPLYVILDAPTSVFSALWKYTAPEYAARATAVHSYLRSNADGLVTVNGSEFATRVANPYALTSPIQELVLSLLCYTDYKCLSPAIRKDVERTLTPYADGMEINCTCTCYEIIK